jgi:hypothetical protein
MCPAFRFVFVLMALFLFLKCDPLTVLLGLCRAPLVSNLRVSYGKVIERTASL